MNWWPSNATCWQELHQACTQRMSCRALWDTWCLAGCRQSGLTRLNRPLRDLSSVSDRTCTLLCASTTEVSDSVPPSKSLTSACFFCFLDGTFALFYRPVGELPGFKKFFNFYFCFIFVSGKVYSISGFGPHWTLRLCLICKARHLVCHPQILKLKMGDGAEVGGVAKIVPQFKPTTSQSRFECQPLLWVTFLPESWQLWTLYLQATATHQTSARCMTRSSGAQVWWRMHSASTCSTHGASLPSPAWLEPGSKITGLL